MDYNGMKRHALSAASSFHLLSKRLKVKRVIPWFSQKDNDIYF